MSKKILLHAIVLSSLTASYASDNNAEINDFKSLLENVSTLATKKSLNVDYMPSVVSIVDAQTYLDAGIQNVGEALGMLPGIQMQLSPMGYSMATVRGFKNPNAYLSDKIKILIDGVAINNEVSGSGDFYMDFPLQLVDRIEVLRGPNSTTQGSGAFYGTVNIITKLGNSKEENKIFLGTGSYSTLSAGANIYTLSNNWKLFSDGYVTRNDKSLPIEGSTTKTNEAMRDVSIGFKAVNGDFEFLTRYKRSVYGNFYGFEEDPKLIWLSPNEHINSYFFSQASYKANVNEVGIETKVNFSQRELNEGSFIAEKAVTASRFAAVGVTNMQEGFYFTEKLREQNFEAETIFTLPKINSNEIIAGVGARYVRIPQDDYYNSVENAITQNLSTILSSTNYNSFRYRASREPAFWANPTTNFIRANQTRTIGYGYIQDLISLTPKVDVILGARVDDYSDIGTKLSQRAAVVYRADDKTIFKLLYGSAFRAPTFTEAYANGHINYRAGTENIKPEETDTYEAVALYTPDFNNKFSLDFFYSNLKNVIDLEEFSNTIPGYQNYNDRRSKGIEFEYSFQSKPNHNFYFNASYIETGYTVPPENDYPVSVNQSMPDISKVMLKAMYVYRPIDSLSFGTTWQYYSQTTQSQLGWIVEDGVDTTVHQQHIVDETLTYKFSASSEMRATVKNIFNEDIRQPSYYYNTDGGIKREGRNYLFSYVQRF
ncbi:TonB-dependent receptor [Sulfuricurvum sp.]|uniref:TonB-dependent receptor plug domain-containing protein n=1 Tax=Sulfuricurvum sp. TaxID=2025608 RepID=UPI0026021044|nr:TonB-dependent receptor [Sulfuricurvum sp.]MDD2266537.1 TonB-dependent receptor [Sulfuricurvum sp.]MDD2783409.1 TonB-dependent receptor [Sulfuricurvum sp.]